MTQIIHSQKLLDYVIPVSLGQTVWFEIRRGFVVPATVTELDYVAIVPKELQEKYKANKIMSVGRDSVWVYVFPNETICGIPEEDLDKLEAVNQFFSTDEIVGHSVQMTKTESKMGYYPDDGFFLSLQDALTCIDPIDKRQAKRRHKKVQCARQHKTDFVNSTHIRSGGEPMCPLVTTQKPIYTKVGKRTDRIW